MAKGSILSAEALTTAAGSNAIAKRLGEIQAELNRIYSEAPTMKQRVYLAALNGYVANPKLGEREAVDLVRWAQEVANAWENKIGE